jgi:threonine aldolase
MRQADFRSDTLTQPSPIMREAMAAAVVGDDVLDGDPTVGELEREAAHWLGKPGALFVPSGTMANQVALGAWTEPGDEIIVSRWAHVTSFEAGAAGYLHGLQSITLGDADGGMDPEAVREALRPDFIHCPRTALVCLEQTHNYAGGRVLSLSMMNGVAAVAREAGVRVHLDGARLANAVVASGISAPEWCASADSVSLCLSKGLGAPVGSVIAGDEDFLERARLMRKRLGGWMRQAGVLAAAGLIALRDGVQRLELDHELAQQLAQRLGQLDGLSTDPDGVDTNIVLVGVEREGWNAPELAEALGKRGVGVMPMGQNLRFVTHLGVGPEDLDQLVTAAADLLQ